MTKTVEKSFLRWVLVTLATARLLYYTSIITGYPYFSMRTRVIILAAGKGTRLNGLTDGLPKVLIRLNGQPMIQYLLDSIKASGADPRPVIVVGHNAQLLPRSLGPEYEYVYQKEQLGTGHAVACAEPLLRGKTDAVIVLYGDHPFVQPSTINKLQNLHRQEGRVLSMLTTTVEDFNDWRAPFADFGRVLRDQDRKITGVVEVKDATLSQRQIQEVNPSYFCFDSGWLWKNLKSITNNNVKREYYLTDLVRIAIDQGEEIASMDINPLESIGINTPEHLGIAQQFVL